MSWDKILGTEGSKQIITTDKSRTTKEVLLDVTNIKKANVFANVDELLLEIQNKASLLFCEIYVILLLGNIFSVTLKHDNEESPKSHWRRSELRSFRCFVTMWRLTFSEHHHKHLSHPAVLDYSFVYDMALFKMKDYTSGNDQNSATFVDEMLKIDSNVEVLANVGQAARYDPRNR